ncbi:TonB family protein [Pokkaliibacter sp. MBI-7]|uniref:energy transducer TonB n=1 Tax=Pokkaliibacter sp. MBI-7 TaxID=3040600 RepID=UPI002446DE27|nr:TonB family protein [Pokkaliibacter sp. MBI-7]MDH2436575.1 TonB family protein [Pokkaliibacter sp. MBI-7]
MTAMPLVHSQRSRSVFSSSLWLWLLVSLAAHGVALIALSHTPWLLSMGEPGSGTTSGSAIAVELSYAASQQPADSPSLPKPLSQQAEQSNPPPPSAPEPVAAPPATTAVTIKEVEHDLVPSTAALSPSPATADNESRKRPNVPVVATVTEASEPAPKPLKPKPLPEKKSPVSAAKPASHIKPPAAPKPPAAEKKHATTSMQAQPTNQPLQPAKPDSPPQTDTSKQTPPKDSSAGSSPLTQSAAAANKGSPSSASDRYTLGSADNPSPHYPSRARQNNWQGRVTLRVTLTPDGRAEKVDVAESSGYGVLDRAALATVQQWRFRAGSSETVLVPIRFKLQ